MTLAGGFQSFDMRAHSSLLRLRQSLRVIILEKRVAGMRIALTPTTKAFNRTKTTKTCFIE